VPIRGKGIGEAKIDYPRTKYLRSTGGGSREREAELGRTRKKAEEKPGFSSALRVYLRTVLADHVVRNRLRQPTLDIIDRPPVYRRIIIDAGHCRGSKAHRTGSGAGIGRHRWSRIG
jgi:hypothetical protein